MKNLFFVSLIIVAAVFSACNNQNKTTTNAGHSGVAVGATGPDVIIYRTKADYHKLVPVTLNEEKTRIVSFPAPKDLYFKGKPALPTILADGFLLDNRGINENVAFLNISYEDYMALDKTPSQEALMNMLIDADPLSVMYSCGKRSMYKDEVRELNAIITSNDFSAFKKLK
jgi:hypothetical protein